MALDTSIDGCSNLLDPLKVVDSAFVFDISGIEGGGGFEEDDPAFFFGDGTVLDAAGDDDELAGFDPLVMVAKFHAEAAFNDEKHFVFVVVMVEDEGAVEFDEFDLLSVQFGGDSGLVEVGDEGEFFGDVDFGHDG
jgi:hypothetical protein